MLLARESAKEMLQKLVMVMLMETVVMMMMMVMMWMAILMTASLEEATCKPL